MRLHREWLLGISYLRQIGLHDVDVTAFGYKYGQMAGQPLYFESSRYFVSEMKKVLEEEAATTYVGLITTGDSFIASEEKVAADSGAVSRSLGS